MKKGVLDVAHLKRQVLHSSWSIANMPVLNCSFDSNSQLPQPAEDFASFLRVAGTCQHTSSDLQKKSKEPPKLFLWLILAFDIRNWSDYEVDTGKKCVKGQWMHQESAWNPAIWTPVCPCLDLAAALAHGTRKVWVRKNYPNHPFCLSSHPR